MDAMVSGIEVETVELDRDSATARTQFDRELTSASMAVVATLAEVKDVDPVDLDPLNGTIDPDAMDALFSELNGMGDETHVSFTHADHAITVTSGGVVTISPEHEPTENQTGGNAGI